MNNRAVKFPLDFALFFLSDLFSSIFCKLKLCSAYFMELLTLIHSFKLNFLVVWLFDHNVFDHGLVKITFPHLCLLRFVQLFQLSQLHFFFSQADITLVAGVMSFSFLHIFLVEHCTFVGQVLEYLGNIRLFLFMNALKIIDLPLDIILNSLVLLPLLPVDIFQVDCMKAFHFFKNWRRVAI